MDTDVHFLYRLLYRAMWGICLFWLLLAHAPAHALDADKDIAQARLDVWTSRDGLPPRDIEAIAQTPDGYLWLATRAGLVRFDGVTFQTFNSVNTPGFVKGMIRALAVGMDGRLWVGTDGDGFGTFANDRYQRVALSSKAPQWSEFRAIYPARDGSVWLGGLGEHPLVHMRGERAEIVSETIQNIRGIVEDAKGVLWIAACGTGLLKRLPNGDFAHVNAALPTLNVTAIYAAGDGSLWVGTEHDGLCKWQEGKVCTYTTRDGLASNEIHAIRSDRAGNLWIGTRKGISRWQNNRFVTFSSKDSLLDSNVGPMLEDHEGNLWAGTGRGLGRFSNTKLTPYELPGMKGAQINDVCETEDGSHWFGTTDGLAHLSLGKVATYTARTGLPSSVVISAWAGTGNRLWLLTEGGALLQEQSGRFTTLLPKSNLTRVAEDREGVVLANWNGLYRLRNGKLAPIASRAACGYIFTFCRDKAGTLWFGCDKGLGHIQNGRVELYREGLPADAHVLALACGSTGALWLGTDKGLACLREGRFAVYNTRCGLPDDNLYQLLLDDAGTLWIGGNRGLFTVKLSDLAAFDRGARTTIPTRLYNDSDGMRQFPLTAAALKTRDGKLWFKGSEGVTIVDPRKMAFNSLPPTILIDRVVIDNRALSASEIMREAAQIDPGKGEMEIDYTALSLTMPEKMRFRYQLEGFDRDWVDAGTRRAAYYTNLPPGTYRFRVLACNNDGVWNNRGAEFAFTLQPRLYQTPWFKAVMGLSGLGLLTLLIRWRVRRLQRANRHLETRIAQRTAQLVQANQELQASHESVEAANARLHALATTDGMTALTNHRAFQDELSHALMEAAQTGRPLTMLLADVDHFKHYNDTFGHPAGDEVLRIVGRLLRAGARKEDCVARYGGEEFAVLLRNADENVALEIAERIRASVATYTFPFRRVTLSIGVAQPFAERFCPETLVDSADKALYAAKRAGRNCVVMAGEQTISCGEEGEQTLADEDHALPVAPPANMEAAPAENEHDVSTLQGWGTSCPDDVNLESAFPGYEQTLTGLLALLNLRDPETDGHSQRVARYALRLAQEVIRQGVAPLSPDELRDLTLGALLHDIGKIGVPDAILHKPGALTPQEWEIMRLHPKQGAEILSAFSNLVSALPVVRSHHERWDGKGYPDGLTGREIPLAARLFAIADTLDAMSSDRPYRAALPLEVIRREVTQMAGSQFDPLLVQVFLAISPEEWQRLQAANGSLNDQESNEALNQKAMCEKAADAADLPRAA